MSAPDAPERRGALSHDTGADVEHRHVAMLRQMSSVERATLVSGLTRATIQLAEAGIRRRYPDASDREQFLRLAILTLGPRLAEVVYPDAGPLLSPGT